MQIKRDIEQRGVDLSLILTQYLENIKPMHDLFVQPSKQYADLVITQDQAFFLALEMIGLLVMDFKSSVFLTN